MPPRAERVRLVTGGMVLSTQPVQPRPDRGFHALAVKRVVQETADAASLVFDIPSDLADRFRYASGQFVTLRAVVDGEEHLRCYSMSSAPGVDDDLQITVKRVAGGVMSNWLMDRVAEGDLIEATVPTGEFVLDATERDIVAFAAGSGITPVFSIVKTALATTTRRVRLLYANRNHPSVIFADALAALVARHGDRLQVLHHLDDEYGLVREDHIEAVVDSVGDAGVYICGPVPFMDVVEGALRVRGVTTDRVHIERFEAPPAPDEDLAEDPAAIPTEVTFRLGGRTTVTQHRQGLTLLQTARTAGLRAPSSCETGSCATCMARVLDGCTLMRHNGALTPEEVEEGWVLTCQAEPTTPSITIVYE
jgi:3-ketosteroid 9alpha-monooxygenase subunit B